MKSLNREQLCVWNSLSLWFSRKRIKHARIQAVTHGVCIHPTNMQKETENMYNKSNARAKIIAADFGCCCLLNASNWIHIISFLEWITQLYVSSDRWWRKKNTKSNKQAECMGTKEEKNGEKDWKKGENMKDSEKEFVIKRLLENDN